MAHPEIPSRPCSNPLAGMVLLVAAAALFSSAAPAHHASGEDLARQAAARIRSGIPEVERQLAVDLLIGLGDDAFPVIETLAASNDPIDEGGGPDVTNKLHKSPGVAIWLPVKDLMHCNYCRKPHADTGTLLALKHDDYEPFQTHYFPPAGPIVCLRTR